MSCKCCDTSLPIGMGGKLMLCNNNLVSIEHANQVINGVKFKPDWCPKQNNYRKLKRIYELILKYEKEYGRKIALETIEVSNDVRTITTIDELLEDLENNK